MPKKVQLGKILLQQTTIFQKNCPKNKKKIVKREEAKAKNIFNRNHSQTKSFAINNKRHTNQQTARSTPQFPPTKNQKPENVEHSIIPTQSTNPKKKNREWDAIPGQDGRQGSRPWPKDTKTLPIRAIQGHKKQGKNCTKNIAEEGSGIGEENESTMGDQNEGDCGEVGSAAANAAVVGGGRDEGAGGGAGGWVCLTLCQRIWAPHSSSPASPVQPKLFPCAPPVGTPTEVNYHEWSSY